MRHTQRFFALQSCATGRPRGSVLIVTMWAIIAITGVVLTLSYSMRIEAIASANRLAQVQADAAERGAEQFLRSAVDSEVATPGYLDQLSFEGRQIGDSFVWIVRPDWDNDQQTAYGMLDEAGKIDLNTASASMLLNLPGMTEDVRDCIMDWRSTNTTPRALGAKDDYYLSLPEPYRCKSAPFDSVDELLLVKGVTRELLYGNDRNRNGTIDTKELASGSIGGMFDSGGTGRGIFPFVTAYGVEASGTKTAPPASGNVNNPDANALRILFTGNVSGDVNALVQRTVSQRGQQGYSNVFDFYAKVNRAGAILNIDDFTKLYPRLSADPVSRGPTTAPAASRTVAKVNVNTAPREVLVCLGNPSGSTQLDDTDAATIISRRQATTDDPSNIAWLASVLTPEKAAAIGGWVTGTSLVYSADIVALSPDGRAFRRCRVVISGKTTPARIIYRRDLTNSGWPLPPEVRAAIRAGEQYQAPMTSSSKGGIGL